MRSKHNVYQRLHAADVEPRMLDMLQCLVGSSRRVVQAVYFGALSTQSEEAADVAVFRFGGRGRVFT